MTDATPIAAKSHSRIEIIEATAGGKVADNCAIFAARLTNSHMPDPHETRLALHLRHVYSPSLAALSSPRQDGASALGSRRLHFPFGLHVLTQSFFDHFGKRSAAVER